MSDVQEFLTRAEADALVDTAVQQAVEKTTQRLLAMLAEQRGAPVEAPAAPADQHFARALATEIAQLADQGKGMKRVPAEVLEKRSVARERMMELIVRNRARNERPEYELVATVFLEDRLINPVWIDAQHVAQPTRIRWRGVPNGAMRPVDEAAREVHQAFCESIGSAMGGPTPIRAKITAMGHVLESLPEVGDLDLGDEFNEPPAGPPRMSDLEIGGRGNANRGAKTIAILGTVARPAVQTVF